MGLPKVNRLKNRKDFQQVHQKGMSYCGRYLVLRTLLSCPTHKEQTNEIDLHKNQHKLIISANVIPQPPKIGISISKKVSKKAVVRNRIKRQIRAIFQGLLPQISPNWKIIVVVRTRATECEYEHFLRELKKLLKQAKVIDGN